MKPHLERRAAEMRRRYAHRPQADTPRDPQTAAEWQEAVDAAEVYLSLDSCQQYGLITGAPAVNIERALELLERGRERGITPAPFDDLVKRFIEPA
jgi:hypothetical protein